jgi:transcriptional regulator with XRE-family HTH domain
MATKNQTPEAEEQNSGKPEVEQPGIQSLGLDLPLMASEPPEARLGERIKHIRKSLTLNIEVLSRLTKEYDTSGSGLSPSSISRYETGDGLPGVREFRLLCESLGVPAHWLLYGNFPDESVDPKEVAFMQLFHELVGRTALDASVGGVNGQKKWFKEQVRASKLQRARTQANE